MSFMGPYRSALGAPSQDHLHHVPVAPARAERLEKDHQPGHYLYAQSITTLTS